MPYVWLWRVYRYNVQTISPTRRYGWCKVYVILQYHVWKRHTQQRLLQWTSAHRLRDISFSFQYVWKKEWCNNMWIKNFSFALLHIYFLLLLIPYHLVPHDNKKSILKKLYHKKEDSFLPSFFRYHVTRYTDIVALYLPLTCEPLLLKHFLWLPDFSSSIVCKSFHM